MTVLGNRAAEQFGDFCHCAADRRTAAGYAQGFKIGGGNCTFNYREGYELSKSSCQDQRSPLGVIFKQPPLLPWSDILGALITITSPTIQTPAVSKLDGSGRISGPGCGKP